MRAIVLVIAVSSLLGVTSSGYSQNQQNNKNAPAAPPRPIVRQQPVLPIQQARPGIPAQQTNNPGQFQRAPVAGAPVRIARPGVVRGPAGSLRRGIPPNVVHNARHMAGAAGARYNRQAFMFRRGNHFYRRAYYTGPDGGVFFYDEPVPDGDPSIAAVQSLGLPSCPEDADDCQGFVEQATAAPQPIAGQPIPQTPLPGEQQYETLRRVLYATWNPPPGAPVLNGELSIDTNGQLVGYRFFVGNDPLSTATVQSMLVAISQNLPLTLYADDAAGSADGIVRVSVQFAAPARAKAPAPVADTGSAKVCSEEADKRGLQGVERTEFRRRCKASLVE
jgi:hypothetical protein